MAQNIDQTFNQLPIYGDARKYACFNYTLGRSFRTKIIIIIPLLFFGLLLLLMSFSIAANGKGISVLARVGITLGSLVLGIWLLTCIWQRLSMDMNGISMYNLKNGILLKHSYVKWDQIQDIQLNVIANISIFARGLIGITTTQIVLTLKDGTTEKINSTALNQNPYMLYNLLCAYTNQINLGHFDWYAIMRHADEKESMFRSVTYTICVTIFTFLLSVIVLTNIIDKFYDFHGRHSLLITLIENINLWGSLLLTAAVTIYYYHFRRNQK